MLISIFFATALPAYNIIYVYPSFTRQMLRHTEEDAIRVARHLTSTLVGEQTEITSDYETIKNFDQIREFSKNLGLMKVKLFSHKGEIIYSTDPGDIGKINKNSYFHQVVAKGNSYTKYVEKKALTADGEKVEADVVETYVPIRNNGKFIGAFELYYDISKKRAELDRLYWKSSAVLTGLAMILLITIILVLKNHAKTIDHHKQAVMEIEESEARLRDIFFSMADWVWETDAEGKYIYSSGKVKSVLGYDKEEIIGKTPFDFMPEDEVERIKSIFGQIVSGKEPIVDLINWNLKKDGSRVCLQTNGVPILDANGELTGYRGVDRDITEKVISDEKLRKKTADIRRLSQAIDQSPVTVVITDPQGNIQYVNPKFSQITGYTFEEAMGQNPRILKSGEQGAEVYKDLWETITSGKQWSGEFHNKRKDGSLFWERAHISPVYDSDGDIANYIALKEDITLQKAAEDALRDSEERHRTIMETCTDPIVVYDSQGKTVFINEAFTRVCGWVKKDVIGKRIDFVPDEALSATQKAVKRVLGGERITDFESRRYRKDGELIDVCLGAALLRDANGESVGMVVNFRDVTAQNQIQAALKKAKMDAESASRAKSEFLANMSHEIRTPMNGVIGMADMLMDTDLTDSQSELLGIVRRSADHLMTIINDILDLSKIEAGKMDLEEIDFSLFAAVEDAAEALSFKAHEKGLELACHIDSDLPVYLMGDPGRLKQIILNLGGNAIKFTEKGEVAIHCRLDTPAGDRAILHFEISDTGIGIPQDKLDSVFESFQQADGSTTRKYGGTGLGLTIARQLTELMGGKIWVQSPGSSGTGTTFHFTVNLEVKANQSPPEWAVKIKDFRGKNVLIVDDNRTNRLVLQEMVSSWGFAYGKAVDGYEAVDLMLRSREKNVPYDLVLMDMQMPGMSGFELAKRIKKEGFESIPIIVLTSTGIRGDAKKAGELGIDAYLLKPIKKASLFQALSMVMSKSGAGKSEQRPPLVTRHSIREDNLKRHYRVLLAEDDAINRKLAVMLLEKHGHSVTAAVNGKQAVELFEQDSFDIVLMDLQMPVMNGLEATRLIREREASDCGSKTEIPNLETRNLSKIPGGEEILEAGGKQDQVSNVEHPDLNIQSSIVNRQAHIPIIAMTAHALTSTKEKALKAGMDDYITKPIDAAKVMATLSIWVGNREKQPVNRVEKPQSVTDAPPMDMDKALERTMGDKSFLDEMIAAFAGSLPGQMDEVRSAFESGDAPSLAEAAHKIKGAAASLSAGSLVAAALALEKAGRNNELSAAAAIVVQLEKEITRFSRFAGKLKLNSED